jgi:hypothetical protein
MRAVTSGSSQLLAGAASGGLLNQPGSYSGGTSVNPQPAGFSFTVQMMLQQH